jgi:hypothetical protein
MACRSLDVAFSNYYFNNVDVLKRKKRRSTFMCAYVIFSSFCHPIVYLQSLCYLFFTKYFGFL